MAAVLKYAVRVRGWLHKAAALAIALLVQRYSHKLSPWSTIEWLVANYKPDVDRSILVPSTKNGEKAALTQFGFGRP